MYAVFPNIRADGQNIYAGDMVIIIVIDFIHSRLKRRLMSFVVKELVAFVLCKHIDNAVSERYIWVIHKKSLNQISSDNGIGTNLSLDIRTMRLHAAFELALVIFAVAAVFCKLPKLFPFEIRNDFHLTLKSLQFFIIGEIHFSNSFLVFVSNSCYSL